FWFESGFLYLIRRIKIDDPLDAFAVLFECNGKVRKNLRTVDDAGYARLYRNAVGIHRIAASRWVGPVVLFDVARRTQIIDEFSGGNFLTRAKRFRRRINSR